MRPFGASRKFVPYTGLHLPTLGENRIIACAHTGQNLYRSCLTFGGNVTDLFLPHAHVLTLGAADITTRPFYLDMHTLPSTQSLSSSSSSSSSSCTRHAYPTHKDCHVLLLARVLTVLTLLPDHSILTYTPCHQTITQYYDHHSLRHSHHHHHAHDMRTLCMSITILTIMHHDLIPSADA